MELNVDGKILNLGCGFKKFIGAINVDAYSICDPDIVWDLNKTPWEWAKDEEFKLILAYHVMEHLVNWWEAFQECVRILKKDGILEIRLPDESSSTALSYRDHFNVFTSHTFHGLAENQLIPYRSGTNAWALSQEGRIPLKTIDYKKVPFPKYSWMIHWPFRRALIFCSEHMRNFIWEQIFVFRKI